MRNALMGGGLLWISLILARAAAAVTVVLDPAGWTSTVTDRVLDGLFSPTVSTTTSVTALPGAGTSAGAVQGDSAASVDYALSDVGFRVVFDQQVAAPTGSFSQSTAVFSFSVEQDAAYEITGSYALSDAEGRGVYFRTSLRDMTEAPTLLFQSNQYSNQTPDESFRVGQTGGDASNALSGSATGALIAGRVYHFYADAALESWPDVPRSTTARGGGVLSLSIVPEPASAWLLALGLALLGAPRRPRPAARAQ